MKPTAFDPQSFNDLSNMKPPKYVEADQSPQEKFEFPVSEAQNIGWMHDQAWRNGRDRISKTWYRGKGTTDVTQFADTYYTMTGSSPFADSK